MASTRRTRVGDHPSEDTLRAFLRAEETFEEGQAIRQHLSGTGCLRCLLELNRLLVREREAGPPLLRAALQVSVEPRKREDLIQRVSRRGERVAFLRSIEETLASELLREILLRPPSVRRDAVRSTAKYQLLGLAEYLVERARSEIYEDVGRAAELGALAVEVAESLSPEIYGSREVATAQGRAWGAFGNALRVRTELREAERALGMARDLLETKGHGSATDRAEILSLVGSLRMSQARFEEAQKVLEEAVGLYAHQKEEWGQAKVLVKLARAMGEGGAPEEAVSILERAEELLDEEAAGCLVLFERQARAAYLNEAGRTNEARELLEALRPTWLARLPQFANQQRFAWLEARILWSEEDVAAAEETFLAVQRGWEERDEGYEYALVSLELAALYLEQGRTAEVRKLGERMLPIFQSEAIHRHALGALALVQQAIAAESVTVSFLQDIVRYLQRARSNPDLTYSPKT